MTGSRLCLRALFVFAVLVQVTALDVTTTWMKDTAVGSTATLNCSWTTQPYERPLRLTFALDQIFNDYLFFCSIENEYSCNRSRSMFRMGYVDISQRGSISMVMEDLQCSDDGTIYICLVDVYPTFEISKASLTVQVPPSAPELSNVQTDVQENSDITATCTAIVGYPEAGQIVWRAYQNGGSIDLSSQLKINVINVPQPGDDKCTIRIQSSATLKANMRHQGISLACFVINEDFKPTAPDTCADPETDLCVQTDPAVVTCSNSMDIFKVSMIVVAVTFFVIIIILIAVIIVLTRRRSQCQGEKEMIIKN
ncbi:CD276 antigen-like [Biomphalaria glabrata]|uniref:CD276 antigen-like n=1 Tax=Biomphalaria glabrata TaxID=6526 RepID=A0A9U8E1D5_BIOGL|nr:CD276 antigen-like [Biomphalaria glabrata]